MRVLFPHNLFCCSQTINELHLCMECNEICLTWHKVHLASTYVAKSVSRIFWSLTLRKQKVPDQVQKATSALSRVTRIKLKPFSPTSLRYISILFSNLYSGLSNGLFTSEFVTTFVCVFVVSPIGVTCLHVPPTEPLPLRHSNLTSSTILLLSVS